MKQNRNTQFRDALTGPIASVRTPFKADGSIDIQGLRAYVDFILEAGSRTVVLTHGDSLFSVLSNDEIAEVTRVVHDQTAGRAMVCAATGIWHTAAAVAFAEFCADLGVDMLMALPPDWGQSCDRESLVDYFRAVSEPIPVMMVTNIYLRRGDAFGLSVVQQVRDEVAGVVAVKDDVCADFGRRLSMLVHGTWAVLTGGQKKNHMNAHPYGCDGYLSTYITCKPEVAHEYWNAVIQNQLDEAARIITSYDIPLFDSLVGFRGGFDAGLHGIYELLGIYGRWRRPPYRTLDDEDMERLSDVCRRLSIL